MKPSKLTLAFHLVAFSIYAYSVYWQEVHSLNGLLRKPQGAFAGKWKWLTYWDLILQCLFFGLCLLCDVRRQAFSTSKASVNRNRLLEGVRDKVFHGLAFPFAMYIAGNFWLLYAYDRNLVYSINHEKIYPPWLNHTTHTCVALFVLLESCFCCHPIPTKTIGLGLMSALFATYSLWTLYIALVVDYWIYSVMEFLSWPGRIVMILAGFPILAIFYFLGTALHKLIWRPQQNGVFKCVHRD